MKKPKKNERNTRSTGYAIMMRFLPTEIISLRQRAAEYGVSIGRPISLTAYVRFMALNGSSG